ALLDGLERGLLCWKQLARLDVSFDSESPKPPTEAALEASFTVVTRLGSLCPSLKHCSLPGKASWARPVLLENAWFPQVAPAHKYKFIAVECEIIAMAIFSGRYPPAILATAISAILASAGIMTEAQTEARRDNVQQLREKGGGEGGRRRGKATYKNVSLPLRPTPSPFPDLADGLPDFGDASYTLGDASRTPGDASRDRGEASHDLTDALPHLCRRRRHPPRTFANAFDDLDDAVRPSPTPPPPSPTPSPTSPTRPAPLPTPYANSTTPSATSASINYEGGCVSKSARIG
ncbi:hypothetical protein K525DRAFT_245575, partial [Schizophyllum commune Loenen D]